MQSFNNSFDLNSRKFQENKKIIIIFDGNVNGNSVEYDTSHMDDKGSQN